MRSLVLVLGTAAAGLAVRLLRLGLPAFAIKYAGSMLWALMIYWIVSTLFGAWRLVTVAMISGVVTAAVELFKLYHSPGMDSFRTTLPGILLLGRYFSVWDIVAYWIAIGVGAVLDQRLRATDR
jgi:Protein of unknown function (DUF2809)